MVKQTVFFPAICWKRDDIGAQGGPFWEIDRVTGTEYRQDWASNPSLLSRPAETKSV